MVSSNYTDMIAERAAVRDAILSLRMLPLLMEHDSAIPDRGIVTNSLKMVDEADVYVVLLSHYRYGHILDDPALNPTSLSVTELEYDRAERNGLKPCVYLQADPYSYEPESIRPTTQAIQAEAPTAGKRKAFEVKARHHSRISATFDSVKDLKAKVLQTLTEQKAALERAAGTAPPAKPRPYPERGGPVQPFLEVQINPPSQNDTLPKHDPIVEWRHGVGRHQDPQTGLEYTVGLHRFSLGLTTEACHTIGPRPRYGDGPANGSGVRAVANGWELEAPVKGLLRGSFIECMATMTQTDPAVLPSATLRAWAEKGDCAVVATRKAGRDTDKMAAIRDLYLTGRLNQDGTTALWAPSLRWKLTP